MTIASFILSLFTLLLFIGIYQTNEMFILFFVPMVILMIVSITLACVGISKKKKTYELVLGIFSLVINALPLLLLLLVLGVVK